MKISDYFTYLTTLVLFLSGTSVLAGKLEMVTEKKTKYSGMSLIREVDSSPVVHEKKELSIEMRRLIESQSIRIDITKLNNQRAIPATVLKEAAVGNDTLTSKVVTPNAAFTVSDEFFAKTFVGYRNKTTRGLGVSPGETFITKVFDKKCQDGYGVNSDGVCSARANDMSSESCPTGYVYNNSLNICESFGETTNNREEFHYSSCKKPQADGSIKVEKALENKNLMGAMYCDPNVIETSRLLISEKMNSENFMGMGAFELDSAVGACSVQMKRISGEIGVLETSCQANETEVITFEDVSESSQMDSRLFCTSPYSETGAIIDTFVSFLGRCPSNEEQMYWFSKDTHDINNLLTEEQTVENALSRQNNLALIKNSEEARCYASTGDTNKCQSPEFLCGVVGADGYIYNKNDNKCSRVVTKTVEKKNCFAKAGTTNYSCPADFEKVGSLCTKTTQAHKNCGSDNHYVVVNPNTPNERCELKGCASDEDETRVGDDLFCSKKKPCRVNASDNSSYSVQNVANDYLQCRRDMPDLYSCKVTYEGQTVKISSSDDFLVPPSVNYFASSLDGAFRDRVLNYLNNAMIPHMGWSGNGPAVEGDITSQPAGFGDRNAYATIKRVSQSEFNSIVAVLETATIKDNKFKIENFNAKKSDSCLFSKLKGVRNSVIRLTGVRPNGNHEYHKDIVFNYSKSNTGTATISPFKENGCTADLETEDGDYCTKQMNLPDGYNYDFANLKVKTKLTCGDDVSKSFYHPSCLHEKPVLYCNDTNAVYSSSNNTCTIKREATTTFLPTACNASMGYFKDIESGLCRGPAVASCSNGMSPNTKCIPTTNDVVVFPALCSNGLNVLDDCKSHGDEVFTYGCSITSTKAKDWCPRNYISDGAKCILAKCPENFYFNSTTKACTRRTEGLNSICPESVLATSNILPVRFSSGDVVQLTAGGTAKSCLSEAYAPKITVLSHHSHILTILSNGQKEYKNSTISISEILYKKSDFKGEFISVSVKGAINVGGNLINYVMTRPESAGAEITSGWNFPVFTLPAGMNYTIDQEAFFGVLYGIITSTANSKRISCESTVPMQAPMRALLSGNFITSAGITTINMARDVNIINIADIHCSSQKMAQSCANKKPIPLCNGNFDVDCYVQEPTVNNGCRAVEARARVVANFGCDIDTGWTVESATTCKQIKIGRAIDNIDYFCPMIPESLGPLYRQRVEGGGISFGVSLPTTATNSVTIDLDLVNVTTTNTQFGSFSPGDVDQIYNFESMPQTFKNIDYFNLAIEADILAPEKNMFNFHFEDGFNPHNGERTLHHILPEMGKVDTCTYKYKKYKMPECPNISGAKTNAKQTFVNNAVICETENIEYCEWGTPMDNVGCIKTTNRSCPLIIESDGVVYQKSLDEVKTTVLADGSVVCELQKDGCDDHSVEQMCPGGFSFVRAANGDNLCKLQTKHQTPLFFDTVRKYATKTLICPDVPETDIVYATSVSKDPYFEVISDTGLCKRDIYRERESQKKYLHGSYFLNNNFESHSSEIFELDVKGIYKSGLMQEEDGNPKTVGQLKLEGNTLGGNSLLLSVLVIPLTGREATFSFSNLSDLPGKYWYNSVEGSEKFSMVEAETKSTKIVTGLNQGKTMIFRESVLKDPVILTYYWNLLGDDELPTYLCDNAICMILEQSIGDVDGIDLGASFAERKSSPQKIENWINAVALNRCSGNASIENEAGNFCQLKDVVGGTFEWKLNDAVSGMAGSVKGNIDYLYTKADFSGSMKMQKICNFENKFNVKDFVVKERGGVTNHYQKCIRDEDGIEIISPLNVNPVDGKIEEVKYSENSEGKCYSVKVFDKHSNIDDASTDTLEQKMEKFRFERAAISMEAGKGLKKQRDVSHEAAISKFPTYCFGSEIINTSSALDVYFMNGINSKLNDLFTADNGFGVLYKNPDKYTTNTLINAITKEKPPQVIDILIKENDAKPVSTCEGCETTQINVDNSIDTDVTDNISSIRNGVGIKKGSELCVIFSRDALANTTDEKVIFDDFAVRLLMVSTPRCEIVNQVAKNIVDDHTVCIMPVKCPINYLFDKASGICKKELTYAPTNKLMKFKFQVDENIYDTNGVFVERKSVEKITTILVDAAENESDMRGGSASMIVESSPACLDGSMPIGGVCHSYAEEQPLCLINDQETAYDYKFEKQRTIDDTTLSADEFYCSFKNGHRLNTILAVVPKIYYKKGE